MTDAAPGAAAALGRQVARNTLAGYLGRAVYVAGWMVLAPWMLQVLGPERFGLWSLVTVVSGLYLTFDFGLQSALIRYVAEFRAVNDSVRLRAVIGMAAALYAGLSAVWVLVLVLGREPLLGFFRVSAALHDEAAWALASAGVAYSAINLSMFVAALYSGIHRMDLWSLWSVLATLLQLAAVVAVLAVGGGVVGVVLANGAALLLSGIVGLVYLRRLAPDLRLSLPPWPAGLWGRLARYSLALQVINLGLLVLFQLEKLLYGRYLGLTEVGEWELAYRLAFGAWSLPALLLPPLLSAIAHLSAAGERERLRRLTERASRVLLVVAFPLAAGLVALAPAAIAAWLGEGHALAARATVALGLALGVNILTGVGATLMRGLDRAGLEAEYHLIGIVLHVGLGLWLVPRVGFDGGLIAVVASTVVSSLWFVFRYHRAIGEPVAPYLRGIVLPLAAAAAAGGLAGGLVARQWGAWSADPSRAGALAAFVAGGVVLVAVSALIMWGTRAVTRADVDEVLALVRRRPAAGGAA